MPVVPAVFAVAIAWGAALLFACQPMLTKLVLPSYGGTPAVWATANFLFQLLLLIGYLLVHAAVRWLGRRQVLLHVVVVLVPLVVLPLALPVDAAPAADANPVWWLVRTLVLAVGLPFVALAGTGPVLQLWYAWTGEPGGQDPYVLYAASNAGSLIGLLSYPFVVEWVLPLSEQTRWWSIGYAGYAALMLACAGLVLRSRIADPWAPAAVTGTDSFEAGGATEDLPPDDRVGSGRRLRWLFWAFLPAGVSLGVTTHLTTDVAAIPLLWVLPLSLYLVTFILAFGRRTRVAPAWPVLGAMSLALASLVLLAPGVQPPVLVGVALGLALVFLTGLAGHSRLAADRPGVRDLTGFYVVVSVGGLLGGVLNGVVAPLLFSGPWEYPLQLLLVPLLAWGLTLPRPQAVLLRRYGTLGWVAEPLLVAGLVALAARLGLVPEWIAATVGVLSLAWLGVGLLVVVVERRVPLVATALVTALAVIPVVAEGGGVRERTFFGSYLVSAAGERHTLRHGTTLHGWQQWPDGRPSLEPTTYYSRSGPLGDVMALGEGDSARAFGFIGLGVGTALAYLAPGDRADVVEIDPVMVNLASDDVWFTFLPEAKGAVEVHVGDGRIVLRDELDGAAYDVLVVDAFSSDAIPVHLLTREALALYLARTADDGVVALHLSNRHLDLVPVAAELARDAGAFAAVRDDREATDSGATGSTWVAVSASAGSIDALVDTGWSSLAEQTGPLWTDDYSSLVGVLK